MPAPRVRKSASQAAGAAISPTLLRTRTRSSAKNPHFAKSALARYTQWDFIALVEAHGIAWHEKTLGPVVCDVSAKDIVAMLRALMADAGVDLQLQTEVSHFAKSADGFKATLTRDGAPTTSPPNAR